MVVSEANPEIRGRWDTFVASSPMGSFLQSWAWGVFQQEAGFRIRRLLVHDAGGGDLAAVCLCIERRLPLGAWYVYAPWGPVWHRFKDQNPHAMPDDRVFRETLTELAKSVANPPQRRPVYLRVEPRVQPDPFFLVNLARAGFPPLGRGVQPRDTLIMNLQESEDVLLGAMHPKTRYNIRVAVRHGVIVEERTSPEGLRMFLALAKEVEERGAFRFHPPSYYEAMLRVLGREGLLRIVVAAHQGTPLAAALLVEFCGTVTYAHGASIEKRQHVMAPTLLHWEAMLRAKAAGHARYDFFGVAPTRNPRHPWAGVTRFKHGFGGSAEHFVGIADAALDPVQYRLLAAARGLRDLLHH